jgi:hypothetical protein
MSESMKPLSEPELAEIAGRCAAASNAPWDSFTAGRDLSGADNFIRVGSGDDEPDMYVSRASAGKPVPASDADLDFIAHARSDIPRLLSEVGRLKASTAHEIMSTGRMMRSRYEPPENELPSVLATPQLVWRGGGVALAIPGLMIYTTGAYLLVLYRTARAQERTFEHARAAADRLRDLRADGRPVTLLGGEHRDYGFTYRAWVPFYVDATTTAAPDHLTFQLVWPGLDQATHRVEGIRPITATALWSA